MFSPKKKCLVAYCLHFIVKPPVGVKVLNVLSSSRISVFKTGIGHNKRETKHLAIFYKEIFKVYVSARGIVIKIYTSLFYGRQRGRVV